MSHGTNDITFEELKKTALETRKSLVRMVARNVQGHIQQRLSAAGPLTYIHFAECGSTNFLPDRYRLSSSKIQNTIKSLLNNE